MPTTYEKERKLQSRSPRESSTTSRASRCSRSSSLTPSRFCVYVDHPEGVDHALCERVTDVLRDYLREYTIDVSSPGHRAAAAHAGALRRAPSAEGRAAHRASRSRDARKFKGEVSREAGADTSTMGIDGADVDIPYDAIVRGNLIDER